MQILPLNLMVGGVYPGLNHLIQYVLISLFVSYKVLETQLLFFFSFSETFVYFYTLELPSQLCIYITMRL